jgi:hypothetical protein
MFYKNPNTRLTGVVPVGGVHILLNVEHNRRTEGGWSTVHGPHTQVSCLYHVNLVSPRFAVTPAVDGYGGRGGPVTSAVDLERFRSGFTPCAVIFLPTCPILDSDSRSACVKQTPPAFSTSTTYTEWLSLQS